MIICEHCKIRLEDATTDLCEVDTPGVFGAHHWMRVNDFDI